MSPVAAPVTVASGTIVVGDDGHARRRAQPGQLGTVNADCAGPRRPTTTTSSISLWRSASSACGAISVPASSAGSMVRIRATSRATLPLPMITARGCDRSNVRSAKSGCPLYQATNSVAEATPGSWMPGISSRRSAAAPTA
ncbi:hypothetical protein C1Y40_03585 [Mycobacterium talmoniae]|uniref:Uncharacterized protein n=1 Tax=Mycobacterium talmoniae TaxID=1858794 RepID=A0A2S8BI04_9MYCO|nr:hypothetical protein C1Y40_03585 [Mycobacterium talmoniae]